MVDMKYQNKPFHQL